MFEKGRTKELALLGGIALVLVLAAASPAFAWNSTLTPGVPEGTTAGTTILCSTTSPTSGFGTCSSTSPVPKGSYVEDEATLGLDGYTGTTGGCTSSGCGTISFYLVSGSVPETCPTTTPDNAVGEGVGQSVPESAAGTTPGTWHYTNYYSSVPTGLSGTSYYFYVVYNDGSGSNTYPSAYACEPFSGTSGGSFPPGSGVPQFPLGVGLLLALTIPGLLLVRSRYTRKFSSSPVTV